MSMSWVTKKKQRHRQGIRTQTERNRVTRRDRKATWAKPRKFKFKVHNPLVKPQTKHFATAFGDSCIGSISLIWQRKIASDIAPDILGPWFSKGLMEVWWFTNVYQVPIFTQSGLMVDGFPWWTCPRSEPGAPSGQGGASCHVFQDWLEFGKALFDYLFN